MFARAVGMFGLRGLAVRAAGPALAITFQPSQAWCGKHAAVQNVKDETERAKQLASAIEWTRSNGKKTGYTAERLRDEKGKLVWPLVSQGAIDSRLNGHVHKAPLTLVSMDM